MAFDIQLFLCHRIRKLLASINQSPYLIYTVYNIFNSVYKSKETNIYGARRLRSQILLFFYFSSFIFGFALRKKIVIGAAELDGIDIDDNGNLDDLLRGS